MYTSSIEFLKPIDCCIWCYEPLECVGQRKMPVSAFYCGGWVKITMVHLKMSKLWEAISNRFTFRTEGYGAKFSCKRHLFHELQYLLIPTIRRYHPYFQTVRCFWHSEISFSFCLTNKRS